MHSRLFYGAWMRASASAAITPMRFAWSTAWLRWFAIRARSTFAVTRSPVLSCFAHGPPITRLHAASHARRNLRALGAIYQA